MRHKRVGTGITERTVIGYDPNDPSELAQIKRPYAQYMSFKERVAALDALATAKLRAAGIDWPRMPPGVARDSDLGYAGRIHRLALILLPMLDNNPGAAMAADIAFDLGKLVEEAEMKWRFESAAIGGAKLSEGRSVANAARSAERQADWDRWNAEAIAIRREHPKWTEPQVRRSVKKRLGLEEDYKTLQRRIHKP